LADEKGRALLESEHFDTPLVQDPEFVSVVGSMPMSTLAGFPGIGLNHRALDYLLTRLDA
jgi:beta-glucosidase